MAGLPGSIWVDGTDLHYISETGTERKETGIDSGAVAGLAGSIWIEGTQLAYIDSSQHKRMLPYTTLSTVAGLDGSVWIGGELVHYIVGGKETLWHTDTHTDITNAPHADTAHADQTYSAYNDWTNYADYTNIISGHVDAAYGTGAPNTSYYVDGNVPDKGNHFSVHINSGTRHDDGYIDYTDISNSLNGPHSDWPNHSDASHNDWTNHSNVAHADTPA